MLRALVLASVLLATSAQAQTLGAPAGIAPPASVARAEAAAARWPVEEGDFTVRDFRFASGAVLPELKLHYATLGRPRRDAQGHVTNAVMLLHGTGGAGRNFLTPLFAAVLFAPGGALDLTRWYVIMPDAIGHGRSSKPSDGLRARFPAYGYADMVEAQHRLLVEGLKVDQLRLTLGISMGCMHAFVLGETYPGFSRALMPLACLPTPIAGYNRLWRKAVADVITTDPEWRGGNYDRPPKQALRAAASLSLLAGAAPLATQTAYPNAAAADAFLEQSVQRAQASVDANDLLYAVRSSSDYDASARLEAITVPVTWVNSADDARNSPDLGLTDGAVARMRAAKFVLIPTGPKTRGHGTVASAAMWVDELKALIARSGGAP